MFMDKGPQQVFTSNPDSIDEVQHHSPLGASDHECMSTVPVPVFNTTAVHTNRQ